MRASPLLRFSLLSATCLAVLGVALAYVLGTGIRDRALTDARETAQLLADKAFRPVLRPKTSSPARASLARAARAWTRSSPTPRPTAGSCA